MFKFALAADVFFSGTGNILISFLSFHYAKSDSKKQVKNLSFPLLHGR
jgi:hypothetical protein